MEIFWYKIIDSTNEAAKRKAREGLKEGLFIAETQTSGKGRLGRRFYSPKDTGLYLSLLLPMESVNGYFQNSGLRVAVAVCKTIEKICGRKLSLKWVNDLYYEEKKVGGILLETCEGKLVIGIGLNLTTTDFPESIKDTAAPLFEGNSEFIKNSGTVESKKDFATEISKAVFEELLRDCDDWTEFYNSRLLWKNETISYGDVNREGYFMPKGEGRILRVTEKGELVLESASESAEETADEKILLSTGEISIRRR